MLKVILGLLALVSAGAAVAQPDYAARLNKPLALLAQAAANIFVIAESHTRSSNNEAASLLPADEARANEYFRQLKGSAPR